MLRGDRGASSTDPFAESATPTNQWIVTPARIALIVRTRSHWKRLPDRTRTTVDRG